MYNHLLKRIEEPTEQYYVTLMDHSHDILDAISKRGQTEVANDLGMSQAKLSAITHMLRAKESMSGGCYVYYISPVGQNTSKIGVTQCLADRLEALSHDEVLRTGYPFNDLKKYKKSIRYHTITTWLFSLKAEALSAELYIKNKYGHKAISPSTEVFRGDVLTQDDYDLLGALGSKSMERRNDES